MSISRSSSVSPRPSFLPPKLVKTTGRSCWGSPPKTKALSLVSKPITEHSVSGSVAWPASSTTQWVNVPCCRHRLPYFFLRFAPFMQVVTRTLAPVISFQLGRRNFLPSGLRMEMPRTSSGTPLGSLEAAFALSSPPPPSAFPPCIDSKSFEAMLSAAQFDGAVTRTLLEVPVTFAHLRT